MIALLEIVRLAFEAHRGHFTAPGTGRRTAMFIARTLHELSHALQLESGASLRPLALVPTMGALHAGHLSLLQAAQARGHRVAVSIFVNPTQFNNADDLARYPRDESEDLSKLRDAGCDLVWLPTVEMMYPEGSTARIEIGGPACGWEGDARPGHFAGVATVVAKLLNQVRPASAYFGEKDWQQLQVIRRMVAELFMPVAIHGIATAREADGLAMSSRNRFLAPDERRRAPALYQCLVRAARALAEGDPGQAVLDTAREDLKLRGFAIDYVALVDGPTLRETTDCSADARLIAAVRLGSVRLLDNVAPAAGFANHAT